MFHKHLFCHYVLVIMFYVSIT